MYSCCIFFVKSTASIMLLVRFSHTRNIRLNIFPPISISQLILPMAPRLVPFTTTTVCRFVVSRYLLLNFKFLNVCPHITLCEVLC